MSLVRALPGLTLGALALMACAPAFAATSAGQATAQVISPLAVTSTDLLEFGTVVGPGTVTVAPITSAAVYGGGAEGICKTACPLPHAARFEVRGEPGRTYAVAVPAAIRVTAPGGGAAMLIDGFAIVTRSRPGESWGMFDGAGLDRFEVGGVLHLDNTAEPGQYSAQVPVTVQYF